MNHSFYSADRMTHLKIVVVALVAAIGVAALGISAHVTAGDNYAQATSTPVVKATRTMMITSSEQQVVR